MKKPLKYELKHTTIGVDPGSRNIGIVVAHADDPYLYAYKVNMIQYKDAVQRMLKIAETVKFVIVHFGYKPKLCIEGASYGDKYGQVELAEARASIVWALLPYCEEAKIVPPKKIRATVLGNGDLKSKWKGLPHDTLAALNCAYWFNFAT